MAEKRYKKLKTAPQLVRLLQQHYFSVKYLRFGRPLAWVTSGAPVEVLRAMGIPVVYPENFGALCGTREASLALCQTAEVHGYSSDLCSYARGSVGMMYSPQLAPLKGIPRPDVLITCSNICGTVLKWYETAARHYGAPLFVLDTPFIHDDSGEPSPHQVQYVAAQLEEMIAFLRKHTGRKLEPGRLVETGLLSTEAITLWREIRELCQARPSPLNAPDLFLNMAPIVTIRGTKAAVKFYRALKTEVEERVAYHVGAIPEERYRLLWDNIAIWHHLYHFYSQFVDYGACFVVDTYTGGWSMSLEEGEPITALARTYTSIFLNQNMRIRARNMIKSIRDYDVDGFVMHSNRSCKPYSVGQYDIQRLVAAETGRPGLVIEADHSDPRSYSEEPVRARIQTFMEALQNQN